MKENDINLHEGHRKRLRLKFKTHKDVLSDHELLELLLSYSIPRKDTNYLAHKLISEFGSFGAVLKADTEILENIDGLGENTACFLSLIGYVNEKLNENKPSSNGIFTIDEAKKHLVDLFRKEETEVFYAIYLNKQNKVISMTRINGTKSNVLIDPTEITKGLFINKPHSVIIAHNHFSKFPYPSDEDDKATAKIYSILQLYQVNFYDHIIVSGNEIYSYFYDNRLQNIKDKINKTIF